MTNFDAQRDYLAVEVDGLFIDAWTSATFESDLFSSADAFRLSIGVGRSRSRELSDTLKDLREKLKAGAVVKFWVGYKDRRALQGTGIVDAREIENSMGDGTTFSLEGRDLACLLVDSAARLDLYKENTSLVEVARAAVAPWSASPWSLKVKTDANGARDIRTGKIARDSTRNMRRRAQALGIPAASLSKKILEGIDNGTIDPTALIASERAGKNQANGISPAQIYALKVKQAAVQAGETVWEFLDRHAKRAGVLMRMSPDGTLLLMGIDYGQAPLYSLVRRIDHPESNNIISGGERYDTARVYSQVKVIGKTKNGDLARAAVSASVVDGADDAFEHEKLLIVQDDKVRNSDEALARAYRELARTKQGARVLTYTVRGFGQGDNVYATDTICSVWDEIAGVKNDFYVIGRRFSRDMQAGTQTTLRLVPKDSIVLDAEAA